jgi:hypothetical protein
MFQSTLFGRHWSHDQGCQMVGFQTKNFQIFMHEYLITSIPRLTFSYLPEHTQNDIFFLISDVFKIFFSKIIPSVKNDFNCLHRQHQRAMP